MSLDIARLTRGATFRRRMTLPEDSGTYDGMTAQARKGETVTDLAVRPIQSTPFVEVSATAAQTAVWPLGLLPISLRLTVGPEVAHSQTFYLNISPEVTEND